MDASAVAKCIDCHFACRSGSSAANFPVAGFVQLPALLRRNSVGSMAHFSANQRRLNANIAMGDLRVCRLFVNAGHAEVTVL
jgi:hypothetical protein